MENVLKLYLIALVLNQKYHVIFTFATSFSYITLLQAMCISYTGLTEVTTIVIYRYNFSILLVFVHGFLISNGYRLKM
jgi:hypothetical protein